MRCHKLFFIVILVELIIFISGKNMNVEVPNILMPCRFIMLPSRSARAVISTANGSRDFPHDFINFGKVFIWNIVDILKMIIRDCKHMPWIVNPPFGGNKCCRISVLINDVFLTFVLIRLPFQKRTKRANIIVWLVIKHVPIVYDLLSSSKDREIRLYK